EREKALLAAHQAEWLGTLAQHDARYAPMFQGIRWERGWVSELVVPRLTIASARALLAAPLPAHLLRRLSIPGNLALHPGMPADPRPAPWRDGRRRPGLLRPGPVARGGFPALLAFPPGRGGTRSAPLACGGIGAGPGRPGGADRQGP